MENVLDIVYSYTINNKLLDKKAIDQIIKILIKELNIELIDEINIYTSSHTKLSNDDLATYSEGDIDIYLGRIYNYLKKYSINLFVENEKLCKFDKCLLNNLFILKTILHELEHALQNQHMVLKDDDSLEQRISQLELSHINEINSYFDEDRMIYRKLKNIYLSNYNISFLERMADIRASLNTLRILEKSKKEFDRIYEYEKLLLLHTQMCTYKNAIDIPTMRFFIRIDKSREFQELNIGKLDYESRLLYGLDLSFEEYHQNKQTLKKKIMI